VLANDSDPDGDTLTISAFDNPSAQGGTVAFGDSVLLYTPAAGFMGTDTFSYTVSDGRGGTDSATVTVQVQHTVPGNSPPTIAEIADQSVIRNTLTPRLVEVMLVIHDPDDSSFSVSVSSSDESVIPSTTLTCGLDPCPLTLTPAPDKTAKVILNLTVSDGRGGQAQTSFAVNVVPRLVTNADDDGLGSLRRTAAISEPGDVVGFDTEGVFVTPQTIFLSSQIVLDQNLTIEGPGRDNLSVSGNDIVRVFKVTGGADVTLRAMTIADGIAPVEVLQVGDQFTSVRMGGGVLVDAGSKLTISAATITGNRAGQIGGGIANFEGTLVIDEGSIVTANTAPSGGGMAQLLFLGTAPATTIDGSTVSGNSAETGGGIINSLGSVVIQGATVSGNTATRIGGGIVNVGTLVVRDGSSVSGNKAVTEGGGIFNDSNSTLTIRNSTVGGSSPDAGNTALRGGGIFNQGTLTLESSLVAGNKATGTDPLDDGGGGIFNSSSGAATVSGSTVEANGATRGGGMFNRGTLDLLANSIVVGNEAEEAGGGIFNDGRGHASGTIAIRGSTIRANTAGTGGGISNAGGTLIVENGSSIVENQATGTGSVDGGGGLHSQVNATIRGSTVAGNFAQHGGGIRFSGEITIQDSDIQGNAAAEDGGGLYYHGSAFGAAPQTSTIDNTTLQNNTAQRGGGIFFVYRSGESGGVATLKLQAGSKIVGNAAAEGGGLYQTQTFGSGSNARTVLDNSTVEGNTATASGGGILNEGGVLTVQAGSVIADNKAEGIGGGVYARENPQAFRETIITILNSAVSGNTASGGGGIYHLGERATLNGSSVTGNRATGDGGGIYNDRSEMVISGSRVADNKAAGNGGGIYNSGGQLAVQPDPVFASTASSAVNGDSGGNGSRNAGSVTPTFIQVGSSVNANEAGSKGGGIFNASGSTLKLGQFASVTDNTALAPAPSGGGIWNEGALTNGGNVSDNTPDDIAP
jgi:hypothetical protein